MKLLITLVVTIWMASGLYGQGVVNYGPFEGSISYVGERVDASGKLAGWGEAFKITSVPLKLYCWVELSKPLGVNKAEITIYNADNEEIYFHEMKTEPIWEHFLVPLSFSEKGSFKVNITTPFDEEDGGYSIANSYWVLIE